MQLRRVSARDPFHIRGDGNRGRHYTYGGDLANAIIETMEHPDALNNDFNLSTAASTTVLELSEIWKVRGADREFRYISDTPFEHDVAKRVPSTLKAKDVIGFEATTSLSDMLDIVVPSISDAVADGRI